MVAPALRNRFACRHQYLHQELQALGFLVETSAAHINVKEQFDEDSSFGLRMNNPLIRIAAKPLGNLLFIRRYT